jgi:hypothetical protein
LGKHGGQLLLRVADATGNDEASSSSYQCASGLHMPLPAQLAHLTSALQTAGIRFLHPSVLQRQPSDQLQQEFRTFLTSSLGVQQLDCSRICQLLLQVQPNVNPEQRLDHVAYMASNMKLIDAATLAQLKNGLRFPDHTGSRTQRLPIELHFPPTDTSLARLLPELKAAGFHFVHDQYLAAHTPQAVSGSGGGGGGGATAQELRAFLSQMGVQSWSAYSIAVALFKHWYASSYAQHITIQQHIQHLDILLNVLTPDDCAKLKPLFLLWSADALYALRMASDLHFPLAASYEQLQPDLEAAGMVFLHSEVSVRSLTNTSSA